MSAVLAVPMGIWTLALAVSLSLAAGGTGMGEPAAVPEPPGYRLDDYRAPVPLGVAGARAITTAEAKQLWQAKGAIFIDVLPAPRRPEGLRPDTVWKPLPRRDIPGSLWLPDVGRGALNDELDAYFRDNLERATRNSKTAAVVVYCLADCWMSWNATKRAISYGYTHLYWYRDGTTGWEAGGLPLVDATPAPGRP